MPPSPGVTQGHHPLHAQHSLLIFQRVHVSGAGRRGAGGEQEDVVFLPLGAFFAMTPTSGTATNFPRNPARSKHKCACSLPAPRISVPS